MKLFASDYDGTLYKNREITDYDLGMIQRFREEGHKFGIVTGRTIDSILFEINKHNIPYDFVVGINGGVVLTKDHEELFVSELSQNVAEAVMETLQDERVLYYGVNDGYGMSRVHVDAEDNETEFNIKLSTLDELKVRGFKAMYVRSKSDEHAYQVASKINEMYNDYGIEAYPNTSAVDIGCRDVSKSTGIQHILDHLGYTKDQVYTVGDAHNDAPMLVDYTSFVMSNGVDAVKKYANQVVDSVGEAIALTLEKY
ncbi:HAD family hydrolase [Erysipelothrix urinaevulpis]|uniref:HAD family hydrolase n=1 Tax=Erysipelothrix urinaevulpis TaxID=2683717 RepID=UPI0013586F44|nr:HAD family hydrolase [Erysipelothrix urinaevulpis]